MGGSRFDAVRRRFLVSGTALAAGLVVPGLHAKNGPAGVRTLIVVNLHTGEALFADYWRDGRYDRDAVGRIDHVLRDHRADEATHMARSGKLKPCPRPAWP